MAAPRRRRLRERHDDDRRHDPRAGGRRRTIGRRVGSRLVGGRPASAPRSPSARSSPIGWTPCIGVILGGILTLAATSRRPRSKARCCSSATRSGSGIPFIVDRRVLRPLAGALRPLVRHGRVVSLVGGLLVAAIGFAMIFDLLILLPRYFRFTSFV